MLEIERAILCGLLQYGYDAYADIDGIVTPECFKDDLNGNIYRCIESLFAKDPNAKIDIPLLSSVASSLNIDLYSDATNKDYIRALTRMPVEKDNILKFGKKIRIINIAEHYDNVLDCAKSELAQVTGNESLTEILSIVENKVFDFGATIGEIKASSNKIGDRVREHLEFRLANPRSIAGTATGFPIFDAAIGGGLRTGVTLISARPKIGKSTFALNAAIHVAKTIGIPVLIIDTEMQYEEEIDRVLANISRVNKNVVETGMVDDIQRYKLFEAVAEIENLPLYHEPVSQVKFSEVLSIIRRFILKNVGFASPGVANPCVVIYDYFKLSSGDAFGQKHLAEHQLLGYQIAEFHDFCKKFNIPILAFVQQNRAGEEEETLATLAQSDRLAWNAINIAIFARKSKEEIIQDGKQNGNRKIVPLEFRFGEEWPFGNYINYRFDGNYSLITELNTKYGIGKQEDDDGEKIEF